MNFKKLLGFFCIFVISYFGNTFDVVGQTYEIISTKAYKLAPITPDQVYDGDTIQKVRARIFESKDLHFNELEYRRPSEAAIQSLLLTNPEALELWPGIIQTQDGFEVVFNLRLFGIDTPEKHPHHRDSNGVLRSEASLADERAAAARAREALLALLARGEAFIKNPQLGKYAGRYVAELWIRDSDGAEINVSQVLIEGGFGVPYLGGTKGAFPTVAVKEVDKLKEMLKSFEGEALVVYKDTRDYLTVGIGHKVDSDFHLSEGDTITTAESHQLFLFDVELAIQGAEHLIPNFHELNAPRQHVIIGMVFQMGIHGVSKFHRFLEAVSKSAFSQAAAEMRYADIANRVPSRWYEETPNRCILMVQQMKTGVYSKN